MMLRLPCNPRDRLRLDVGGEEERGRKGVDHTWEQSWRRPSPTRATIMVSVTAFRLPLGMILKSQAHKPKGIIKQAELMQDQGVRHSGDSSLLSRPRSVEASLFRLAHLSVISTTD